MSWRIVNGVLSLPTPCRIGPRFMLTVMADRANDDGLCWASVDDLATRAQVTPRHARKLVAELRKAHHVRVVRKGGGARAPGKGWANLHLVSAGRDDVELDRIAAATLSNRTGYLARNPVHAGTLPGPVGSATLSAQVSNPVRPDSLTIMEPAAEQPRERRAGRERIESAAAEKKVGPTNGVLSAIPRPPDAVVAPSPAPTMTRYDAAFAPYYAEWPRYREAPEFLTQRLLRDAGCDDAYQIEAAGCSPERVYDALEKLRKQKRRIDNPGGWLRVELGLKRDMPRYR